ncbi:radical SAM protein [bacterium]|nr:radical SAM protein [bacterium]
MTSRSIEVPSPLPVIDGHPAATIPLVQQADEALRRHRQGRPDWALFDTRVHTHHEAARALPARPLLGLEGTAAIAEACNKPSVGRSRAIYLHVPYCPAICAFCAFFRLPRGKADLDAYVDALLHQIDRYGRTKWAHAGPIEAVYFGGGTPTVLEAHHFERLLERLGERFDLSDEVEITVESRCHGTDSDYWRRLRAAGVNRVSLGVQSFDTDVRRGVGRVSSREEVALSVADLRSAAIPCVTADLIYNLPKQTLRTFQRDLQTVDELSLDGVSIYCLIPFPGSALMRRIEAGSEPPLGGREAEYVYFRGASGYFARSGRWKRMSPVHFAGSAVEHNAYNSVRSGRSDVLGIGSGAGSRVGNVSWMNHMSVEKYLAAQANGESAEAMTFAHPPLSPALAQFQAMSESLAVTLDRRKGAIPPSIVGIMSTLVACGLLICTGDGWSLTETGCFWSYNISSIINSAIHNHLTKTT